MAKTALDAKRGNVFMLEPERLTLVYDKNHPLYDSRVEDAPSESMIANIAMHGVLEPILVRKNGQAVEVIAGRGRTKAALEANHRLIAEGKPPILIPAIIKGGTDADLFGVMISENEIRREDSMIAKGIKARKLLNMGYPIQQIAITFGVSRQAVESWLDTEELPQPIRDAVEAGEIAATAALMLSGDGCSREEQVMRYNDMKQRGTKPTVAAVRNATTDNRPASKVKTRKEIERMLAEQGLCFDGADNGYKKGYLDALRWVLGQEVSEPLNASDMQVA